MMGGRNGFGGSKPRKNVANAGGRHEGACDNSNATVTCETM